MTSFQALNWATKKLSTTKNKTAALDADVLLAFVLKKPKEFLYTHPEYKLSQPQMVCFKQMINRRAKGEPVAYLRNTKEFYGLDFYVDKRVLIPRPETELLVEEVLRQLTVNCQLPTVSIADIGTGSGCIIITLAKLLHISNKLKAKSYYATDISKLALQVAKKNARKHKVKIKFFQGDLLEPLKNIKIDLIVANLPYGWPGWKNNKSVPALSLKFEPPQALFAENHGLNLYRHLFVQIAARKQKPKLVFCEFDPRQKNDILKLANKYLPKSQAEIKKDLAGLDRVLVLSLY